MRAESASRIDFRPVAALVAAVAALYLMVVWHAGIRTSVDSNTYSRWADALIANHFNMRSYLHDRSNVVPPVLYLLWIYVVALLKVALGTRWMAAVVALNWMSLVIGVTATIGAVARLTKSTATAVTAALMFCVAGDLMIFVPFVLSDFMFWAMSTTVLAVGLGAATRSHRPSRSLIVGGTALVAVTLAFRPAALPLLAFWMLALGVMQFRSLIERREAMLLSGFIFLAAVAVIVDAYLLLNPSAWPFGPPPGMLVLLSQEYRDGVLVYAPGSNLLVSPALTLSGTIRLTMEKAAYFFSPWLPHYSVFHAVINAAFFLPAYGLPLIAIARWRGLEQSQRTAIWLLTSYVVALGLFHALVQIEYDHRYRLLMLPALIIMSAIGVGMVWPRQTPASTDPMK